MAKAVPFLFGGNMARVIPQSNVIRVNGVALPCPAPSLEIIRSVVVDSGRNANGTVVGQVIGRKLWKINNLCWNGIDTNEWAKIVSLFDDFYVKVSFLAFDNKIHTVTMYPSDMTGQPIMLRNLQWDGMRTAKFNLIDCGIAGED